LVVTTHLVKIVYSKYNKFRQIQLQEKRKKAMKIENSSVIPLTFRARGIHKLSINQYSDWAEE